MSWAGLAISGEPFSWAGVEDVAEYPSFNYTMKQVQRAGDALKGTLIWTPETEAEIIEIFRIANSWRDSHAFPMQSIRQEVSAKMQSTRLEGITAGRLKRMGSIRKKLRTISTNLNQMQDLGGCRAILPTIGDVRALIGRIKEAAKHDLHNESDYIADPKKGGYRCHHLIFKYRGAGDRAIHQGRRIEIQIRTRLQRLGWLDFLSKDPKDWHESAAVRYLPPSGASDRAPWAL